MPPQQQRASRSSGSTLPVSNVDQTANPALPEPISIPDNGSMPHYPQSEYPSQSYLVNEKDSHLLPSNNSSRTFCERSDTRSPLDGPSKEHLQGSLLREDLHHFGESHGMPNYVIPNDVDPQYQHSPFNFYEPTHPQEEYMRYRPDNHGMYNAGSYELTSYMHHMSQLSSHMEDPNLTQQHCNIPIGKRRPRAIMVSGETEDLGQKLYEEQPADAYGAEQMQHYHVQDIKGAYGMPMSVHQGRYHYHNYSGMVTSHPLSAGDGHSEIKMEEHGMMREGRSGLSHTMYNFESPVASQDESLVLPQPIKTANLPVSRSHGPSTPKSKLQKIAGQRQKHVRRACVHCKKAHLACDEARPCKRCVHLGKTDCVDVEHKRRGRPRSSPEKKRSELHHSHSDYTICSAYGDGEIPLYHQPHECLDHHLMIKHE